MNKKIHEIYTDALHYDLINNFDFDIELYKKLALAENGEVLELACGTGRVAIPLAKVGLRITGLDVSSKMLKSAQAKSDKEGVEIDWVEADMTRFDLKKKYKTIFCVHNSFCHLEDILDVKGFFKSVHQHLEDDGLFVLQLFAPDLDILTRNPDEVMPLISYKLPDSGEKMAITESSCYDEVTQMNYLKWFFKEGKKEESIQYFSVRVYFPQELDNLVQLNGFEIEAKYGDYDETPFFEYPDTQILLLRKAKRAK